MLGSTVQCLQAGFLFLAYVFCDFPSSFELLQELMGTNFQTGKNKPPCRGGREMGSGLAFTDVPFFFLASETRCVDSKGAGVLGEDD